MWTNISQDCCLLLLNNCCIKGGWNSLRDQHIVQISWIAELEKPGSKTVQKGCRWSSTSAKPLERDQTVKKQQWKTKWETSAAMAIGHSVLPFCTISDKNIMGPRERQMWIHPGATIGTEVTYRDKVLYHLTLSKHIFYICASNVKK